MAIPDYLPQLNEAVARIIAEPNTPGLILALKEELKQTPEAFVWATLDLEKIRCQKQNEMNKRAYSAHCRRLQQASPHDWN